MQPITERFIQKSELSFWMSLAEPAVKFSSADVLMLRLKPDLDLYPKKMILVAAALSHFKIAPSLDSFSMLLVADLDDWVSVNRDMHSINRINMVLLLKKPTTVELAPSASKPQVHDARLLLPIANLLKIGPGFPTKIIRSRLFEEAGHLQSQLDSWDRCSAEFKVIHTINSLDVTVVFVNRTPERLRAQVRLPVVLSTGQTIFLWLTIGQGQLYTLSATRHSVGEIPLTKILMACNSLQAPHSFSSMAGLAVITRTDTAPSETVTLFAVAIAMLSMSTGLSAEDLADPLTVGRLVRIGERRLPENETPRGRYALWTLPTTVIGALNNDKRLYEESHRQKICKSSMAEDLQTLIGISVSSDYLPKSRQRKRKETTHADDQSGGRQPADDQEQEDGWGDEKTQPDCDENGNPQSQL